MPSALNTAARERLDKATPGPWSHYDAVEHGLKTGPDVIHAKEALFEAKGEWPDADCDFVAHAPTDIARLLDRVDELEAANKYDPTTLKNLFCGEHAKLHVFLDGRNEHGSHVIAYYGVGGIEDTDVSDDLSDGDDGIAEQILSDSEAAGFKIFDSVWTNWRYDRSMEYWEYRSIDVELTIAHNKAIPIPQSDAALQGASDE